MAVEGEELTSGVRGLITPVSMLRDSCTSGAEGWEMLRTPNRECRFVLGAR